MTLSTFYLICFVVGFSLSALSFFSSVLHVHLPSRWHIPIFTHHSGPAGVHPGGHGAAHAGGSSVTGSSIAHGTASPASTQTSRATFSWLNPSAIVAFLAWFGGAGYLLTQYYAVWYLLALGLAILAGFTGAAIVSWFLVKVLLPHEVELHDADFELAGTLAKVTSSIREGGTGEITYSLGGVRRCAGARSSDGKALEKGSEVVVARYDNGIAYVTRWEEWAK
jgi:membrane protein implicated in regulation of membrane protease activity